MLFGPLYWGSIAMSCIGLIYVEAERMWDYKPPNITQKEYDESVPINLMFAARTHHPLPKEYCTFSGVALLPTFTGWLKKLGKTFSGFIPSMHQIGTNTVYYTSRRCRSTKLRVESKRCKITNVSITRIMKLATLFMSTITCNGLYVNDNIKDAKDNQVTNIEQYSTHWKIDEGDALHRQNEGNVIDFSDNHIVTDLGNILTCMTDTERVIAPIALHNSNAQSSDISNISFTCEATEFGTDNCATHHICSQLNLFTSMRPANSIGVTGVAGSKPASGIGTVEFILKDDNNVKHNIKIDDVIYLPESTKNLISTSRWALDKKDNCGVLSRGTYSVFMWDHDNCTKQIQHSPSCPIPLMPVNENDEQFVLFNATHSTHFPDNGLLLPDGAHQPVDESTNSVTDGTTTLGQQLNAVPSNGVRKHSIPVGSTVWHTSGNKKQIAIITNKQGGDTSAKYTVRPLNSRKHIDVDASALSEIQPNPADIPITLDDVDAEIMTECLSKEDLEQLWSGNVDDTIDENGRLALYWHHRLRHAPLTCLHRLAKRGILPRGILKVRKLPLCAACAFATAHRRGWRTKSKRNRPIRKATQDAPGKGTSCDHIVSHQPGLIPQSTGILTHKKFWGSVLFVDHHSDFLFNHLITGTTSQATLEAKHAYERLAASFNVRIQAYHADNLRFNDNNFQGDCIRHGQTITFCGVGAHHQNAVAESKVKLVSYGARTILLHAKRRWPNVISTALWPFAMQAIIRRHNHIALDSNGQSPMEKFTGIMDDIDPMDFHTWGCPVYILDEANQGAIGTPKWEPRSHIGIYLGHSPQHAGSVALVLNLRTGHVSPQYHIIYDDECSTVPYFSGAETPPNWSQLCQHSLEHTINEDDITSNSWLYPNHDADENTTSPTNHHDPDRTTLSTEESIPPTPSTSEGDTNESTLDCEIVSILPEGDDNINLPSTSSSPASISQNGREDDAAANDFVDIETLGLRRSNRMKHSPNRMSPIDPRSKEIRQTKRPIGFLILAASTFITQGVYSVNNTIAHCFQSRIMEYEDFLDSNFDGTRNSTSPLAQIYLTSKANNEVYTLKEMLAQPDKMEFVKAMKQEVQSLFDEQIWKLVPRQEMTQYYGSERLKGKTIKRE